MQAVGYGPLELLLVLLLGGGFGPSGVPTQEDPLMARIAPAECLVYSSWAGTAAADVASGNHTEQLLAEPEVQKFVRQSRDRLLDLVALPFSRDAEQRALFADIRDLLELLERKPGAFFISHIPFAADTPRDVRGGALLRVQGDSAEIQSLLEKVQSRAPDEDVTPIEVANQNFWRITIDPSAPPLIWGMWDKYLVVGLGDGAAESMLERSESEPPEWLAEVRAELAVPRPSSVVYVNVTQLAQGMLAAAGNPQLDHVVSVLGFDAIERYAAISGLDESGCLTRSLLSVDGTGRGLLSWIDAQPLTADQLQIIDRNAPVAVSFKLDPTAAFDLWLDMASRIDPDTQQRFSRDVAQLNQQLGIDVREDVLKSFGDTWRLFAQPEGGVITGWTAAIRIRDRHRLEEVLRTLVVLAGGILHREGSNAFSIESATVNEHVVYTMDLTHMGVPFAPSWCLTDEELLVTATRETLLPLLGDRGGESLATLSDVKALVGGDSRTLAMGYVDTQRVVRRLLPAIEAGFKAVAGQAGPQFWDTSHLPPADVVLRHLQPTLIAVQRTPEGVEFSSRHTMPGSNTGAAAPVAVAMLLPAVSASRQAARRAQSMNQLKQIALAMHNYHDRHGAFPAGYSAGADGKPLLSWRVHVLPYLEEAELYDRFHLDEPWDSEHNKTLIAEMPEVFRSPNSTAQPGMSNYLGVGGKDGVFVRPRPGDKVGTHIKDILDGTSNTIMTVEVPDESAVVWTRPGDFAPDADQPTKGLLGLRPGGFLAALGDGSVRFISEGIDSDTLRAMFTKSGGEVVP